MTDKQNASQLFLKHYGYAIKLASSYAPFPGLTQDIVHDTYIDFMKKAEKEDIGEDIKPLLSGMIRITAMRLRRALFKQSSTRMQNFVEKIELERKNRVNDIQGHFSEVTEYLDICLKKLSPDHRRMVEEYYYRGITVAELSQRFKVNDSAVRQVFYRIREKLRQCLAKYHIKNDMQKQHAGAEPDVKEK